MFWTYDYENATVRPGREGESQYENTHFREQGDAWKKLIRELEAGIAIGARERDRCRAELARATEALADDAERLTQAKARYAEWSARTEREAG